jgi:RNA recognition motif-containing protein
MSDELREFFLQHGPVTDAKVIMDLEAPGKSRGFGFVTLPSMDTALALVKSSDGQSLMGQPIRASLAKQSIQRAGYGCYNGSDTPGGRFYSGYGSSGRFSNASNGYHAPPWQ